MATTRSKRKGYVDANLYIADVESMALRNDGDETQPALTVKTRNGFITIRLIARPGTIPRFTDLRIADRKRKRAKVTTWNGLEVRRPMVPLVTDPKTSEDAERLAVAREAAQDAKEDR
jgi:hypothetical protein